MKKEQMMRKLFLLMTGILAIGLVQPSLTHAHDDKHPRSTDVEHQMIPIPGVFLTKKEIDGYTVSFHVMRAREGMQHGGAYNLMVKVEKDGKALTNLLINSRVSHPVKVSETKMLMKMGDWYMASYDMGHPGPHQIMVLFKTEDGKEHFGEITYPSKESR